MWLLMDIEPWMVCSFGLKWCSRLPSGHRRMRMTWTTPTLVEICVGLEVNGYLPAEF
jgi:coenzyme PQQ precursor peptide PqqA